MKVINEGKSIAIPEMNEKYFHNEQDYGNECKNGNMKNERNDKEIKLKCLQYEKINGIDNYYGNCCCCNNYNNRMYFCGNKDKKKNDKLYKHMLIKNQIFNENNKIISKISDGEYTENNYNNDYDINKKYNDNSHSYSMRNENYNSKLLNHRNNNSNNYGYLNTDNNYTLTNYSLYTNEDNQIRNEYNVTNNTISNYNNYFPQHPKKDISTNMKSIVNKTKDILNKHCSLKYTSQKDNTIPQLYNQTIPHNQIDKTNRNNIYINTMQNKSNLIGSKHNHNTNDDKIETKQHYDNNCNLKELNNQQLSFPETIEPFILSSENPIQLTPIQSTIQPKFHNIESSNANPNSHICNTSRSKDKRHNYYTLKAFKIREQYLFKTRNNKHKFQQSLNQFNTCEGNVNKKQYCYQCQQLQNQKKLLNQMYYTTKG